VTTALCLAAWLTIIIGVSGLTFHFAQRAPHPRPKLGRRGLERARALSRSSVFRRFEPVIRYAASWAGELPCPRLKNRLTNRLTESGNHLGLSADELIGLSMITALLCSIAALFAVQILQLSPSAILIACLLGALVPAFRVRTLARKRAHRVTRQLPPIIELAAMCMGAGLDFPGSIHRIVQSAARPREPVFEELRQVLRELDLGHTRRNAMMAFAQRIPTQEVREFVNSVVQSEEKGTPLAQVLAIQARTLRLRRSLAAERSASDAALMLVGPMSLIFLCIIVMLLGPVVLRVMSQGFGVS
jgi:tight adherence protein C